MSESSLVHNIDSVLARIDSSALLQQASSSSLYDDIGVSRSLDEFKETLLSFKDTFLEDNGRNIRSYYVMQEWMMKAKQVLDDAENILDDIHSQFQWESLRWLLIKAPPRHGSNLLIKVGRFLFSSSYRALATQINDITQRLQHCFSVNIDYSTEMSYLYEFKLYEPDVNELEESHVDEEESDVMIGRESDKEIIIEKLLMVHWQHDEDDHRRLSVLPIVGIGGLGKSTLANIVFGDKRIHKSFSVRIWVSVSHVVDIEEVIIRMFNFACSFDTTTYSPIIRGGQLTMIQLLHRLENILVGKKFLLVLDDVRRESPLKWDELMNLIQIGTKGSKVLMTTRSHSIASMMDTIPSHKLQRLSLKDSLSLFEKLATKAKAYKCPELIEIGREIVNRCEGIPLAIKTMGSLLFSRPMMSEWESMRNSEFRDLPKHYGILPVLRLSYSILPLYLKKCFQLFSLYPNDYVFHSSEVVSLWAALDLLPSPNTKYIS